MRHLQRQFQQQNHYCKQQLKQLKEETRLVFLTGSRDFNRAETKVTYRFAESEGFEHSTYLEIPDADHYFGISGEWLERALEALDSPLARPTG